MSNKRLNIRLSTYSVTKAIKTLQFLKKQLRKGHYVNDFLELVCEWIIKRANHYVNNSDIGELVKIDIRNGWEYEIKDGQAKILNKTDKAVFVEFGIGLVGQENPHPNATSQEGKNYEYNISTIYKDEFGMWYFWTNSNELDIPRSAIVDIRGYDDFRGRGGEQGKRIIVGTMGAEGVMYAYNALMDAKAELQKPNGDFVKIREKLYNEYIERYLQ